MKIKHDSNYDTNDRIFSLGWMLEDLLPHGSGIDAKWEIQQNSKGDLICFNSYTCYNETGMIDGYADFSVKIRIVNCELHIVDLSFHGSRSQYLANKYDLRSYLEQLFFDPANIGDTMQYNSGRSVTEYF